MYAFIYAFVKKKFKKLVQFFGKTKYVNPGATDLWNIRQKPYPTSIVFRKHLFNRQETKRKNRVGSI